MVGTLRGVIGVNVPLPLSPSPIAFLRPAAAFVVVVVVGAAAVAAFESFAKQKRTMNDSSQLIELNQTP